MVGCITLCGVDSNAPRAPPKWAGPTLPPPKLGSNGGDEKFAIDIAAVLDVAVAGTCPPLISPALRRGEGTNNGLAVPSGRVGARTAGGKVLPGNGVS